jgi:KDO2-lipid IV(A) lauroyltransferase
MSPLLVIRYRLEYWLLRLVAGIIRLFPLDMAADMFAWLLRKLGPGGRRHKKALANLELAFPDKTPEERETIACQMWDNIGRVIAETIQIDRLLEQPERVELEEDYFIHRYKGKMGTVVAASMHMGNWEISSWPLALCDSNVAAVYRLVKNPYVDQYLRSMRGRLYPGGLFAKGRARGKSAGFDTARMIGSYVRHGLKNETASIAFLADLYDGKGIPVPVFGHEAKSTPFPAMLARRLGARLWVGRCIRTGPHSKFRVSVKEIKVPRTDDRDEDIRQITASIQKTFEEWIRETPEQYMWTNRRFA